MLSDIIILASAKLRWRLHGIIKAAIFIILLGKDLDFTLSPHVVSTLNSMSFLLLLFFVSAYSATYFLHRTNLKKISSLRIIYQKHFCKLATPLCHAEVSIYQLISKDYINQHKQLSTARTI